MSNESSQELDYIGKKLRNKEKTIGEVITKVREWRKMNSDSSLNKLSLEEASKKVGIVKKSLDDYLIQIKLGKRNGFDFNASWNSKIGVLRSFNKIKKGDC
jgi:hypothetical protein